MGFVCLDNSIVGKYVKIFFFLEKDARIQLYKASTVHIFFGDETKVFIP